MYYRGIMRKVATVNKTALAGLGGYENRRSVATPVTTLVVTPVTSLVATPVTKVRSVVTPVTTEVK